MKGRMKLNPRCRREKFTGAQRRDRTSNKTKRGLREKGGRLDSMYSEAPRNQGAASKNGPGCMDRRYMSGRVLPEEVTKEGGRPSARMELEAYDGKAPTWFEWIDMFRCIVHESGRPASEKLALLKKS